jgi:hypothetical protein
MANVKATLLLVLPFSTGLVLAQEPARQEPPPAPPQEQPAAAPQPQPTAAPEPPTTGTQQVPAEVVSADAEAKTIKVKVLVKKDATATAVEQEGTLPVDPEAVASLPGVSAGEKVKLLCRMNGNKVIAVKSISKADPAKGDKPQP